MTRRYNLTLQIATTDGDELLDVNVRGKTMDTLHQLVRLSMSDFEKVDPTPPQVRKKHRWGKAKQINPPIEIIDGPSEKDIEGL